MYAAFGDLVYRRLQKQEYVLQASLRSVRFDSSPVERAGLVCIASTQGFLDLMIPQILMIVGYRLPLMAKALAASQALLDPTQAIDGVDG